MLMRRVVLVATLCVLFQIAKGATKPNQLTRFRPISQSEYDAILSLTDGERVVSEGRLIEGGLAALAGLASGWVTSLRLSNLFGATYSEQQKSPSDSYPLCVIKSDELPGTDHHHHNHDHHDQHHASDEAHHHRRSDDSHKSFEDIYEHHYQQYYAADATNENDSHEHDSHEHDSHEHDSHEHDSHEHDSHEHDSHEHHGSVEMVWHKKQRSPVVNCIVVVKEDDDPHKAEIDEHYHTTTKRPKRRRKKHRVYVPSTHLLPQYSAAPPSAYAVQPPPGSYNTPWSWQSPHYNPYYSDPHTRTAFYPPAYPDIYATTNPSTYFGAYPGTFSRTFAAPYAINNPNPYYNPFQRTYIAPASGGQPSIAYNTQPSSSASSYPGMAEVPVNKQFGPANIDSSAFYNSQPTSDGSSASKPHLGLVQTGTRAKYPTQINVSIGSLSTDTPKVSLSTVKTSNKQNIEPQSRKEMKTALPPPAGGVYQARRHTKAKRDETQAKSNSYAKIANYSESGYQPTLYPQNPYPSNYPKVAYTHALSYPAPIYVRNSIEQPVEAEKIRRPNLNESSDSVEDDKSNEFIQVGNNLRLALN